MLNSLQNLPHEYLRKKTTFSAIVVQIRGEGKTVSAKCIFVPDAFLRQINAKLLGLIHLRNLRNLRFTSFGVNPRDRLEAVIGHRPSLARTFQTEGPDRSPHLLRPLIQCPAFER